MVVFLRAINCPEPDRKRVTLPNVANRLSPVRGKGSFGRTSSVFGGFVEWALIGTRPRKATAGFRYS